MAHAQLGGGARPPLVAASQILPYQPISILPGSPGENALPAASVNRYPFGICQATVASGAPVTYWVPGDVGKMQAAASMGAGAQVGVTATTGLQVGPLAVGGASAGIERYAVGVLLKQAAAGDIIPVYIDPKNVL
jgi:hypothetical protein